MNYSHHCPKRGYRSKGEAKRARGRLQTLISDEVCAAQPYRCLCGKWHLGRSRAQVARVRDRERQEWQLHAYEVDRALTAHTLATMKGI